MKILLTTLNAKFVHTSLALWYLYQYCHHDYPGLSFREFNINQDLSWVCGEIYLEHADVLAFSCNIWNIAQILIISKRIKSLAPKTIIILGGSEVSADPRSILATNPAIDFIIVGEGELTFREWLDQLHQEVPKWASLQGLVFRSLDQVIQNPPRAPLKDLSILPFPYPKDVTVFRKKLVYYESSRGCPNFCQYCLSANEHGVRFFSLERVKQDLLRFIEAEIAQVKLVDRSFNCNPAWAKEIWRFLIDHPGQTNFHFEIMGDLLDDESIEILAKAPIGLFQFEIGVQSTNPDTLELVRRKMNFSKLSEQVTKLLKASRVFVHLDLIAGLPGENYLSFQKTFNENLLLKPHRLQLGFLKLLHGSGLRSKAAEYGYLFTEESPYEVMANHWLAYDEILKLKTVEDILERYYNSGRFRLSFEYLIAQFPTPFHLFEQFAAWWKEQGYDQIAHKSKDLYSYLLRFYQSLVRDPLVLRNLLKYDLLTCERLVELPVWAGNTNPVLRDGGYRFWRAETRREQYIPQFRGMAIRDIQRRVVFEEFDCEPEAVAAAPLVKPTLEPTIILFVYLESEVQHFIINRKEFLE